jgi:hypothetical protein
MQFHLKPNTAAPVSPAKLSAFVTADLRFDIPAIRADAKARYGLKLDFINRYTGAPQRHWQRLQARRAISAAWREARGQLHEIVLSQMPRQLPYTPAEAERMAELRAAMGSAAITARGNVDFKSASGEYAQINWNAQQRAYFAIIRQARGET